MGGGNINIKRGPITVDVEGEGGQGAAIPQEREGRGAVRTKGTGPCKGWGRWVRIVGRGVSKAPEYTGVELVVNVKKHLEIGIKS